MMEKMMTEENISVDHLRYLLVEEKGSVSCIVECAVDGWSGSERMIIPKDLWEDPQKRLQSLLFAMSKLIPSNILEANPSSNIIRKMRVYRPEESWVISQYQMFEVKPPQMEQ